MHIIIKVVENGFVVEVTKSGYDPKGSWTYVAENERSLLDTISQLWRTYKNQEATNDNKA